ncbi:unnamed protein product [Durusdinium trenchii]|uniref:Uncharacterized protein n=1 Tax=Durusdinium trenchii TaxID=1381693 RepID=A0ABP0P626_9DINO
MANAQEAELKWENDKEHTPRTESFAGFEKIDAEDLSNPPQSSESENPKAKPGHTGRQDSPRAESHSICEPLTEDLPSPPQSFEIPNTRPRHTGRPWLQILFALMLLFCGYAGYWKVENEKQAFFLWDLSERMRSTSVHLVGSGVS